MSPTHAAISAVSRPRAKRFAASEVDVFVEFFGRDHLIEAHSQAALEGTDNLAGWLAKLHLGPDGGFRRSRNRGTRNRDIDELDDMLVIPMNVHDRMAPKRRDALVVASLGNSEHVAIDHPGKLIGDFFALCERHRHLDRETALRVTNDLAFDAADLIEIDDNTFPDRA